MAESHRAGTVSGPRWTFTVNINYGTHIHLPIYYLFICGLNYIHRNITIDSRTQDKCVCFVWRLQCFTVSCRRLLWSGLKVGLIQIPVIKIGVTSLSRIYKRGGVCEISLTLLKCEEMSKWANIQRNERFLDDTTTRNHLSWGAAWCGTVGI